MIAIVVVVVAVGLVAILRARARAHALTTVGARLTLGTDGIVIGATTIDLAADGDRAVLMLHGFGDTPQTLQYLAAYMHPRTGLGRPRAPASRAWSHPSRIRRESGGGMDRVRSRRARRAAREI